MCRHTLSVLMSMAVGLGLAGCASQHQAPPAAGGKSQPVAAVKAPAQPAADGMSHVSMYFPTGDPSTSSILLERAAPIEVRADQDYEYVMTVRNISKIPLQDVIVRDACATNYTCISSTPPAVGKLPEPLTWKLGDLAPDAEKQIVVKGRAAPDTKTVTNCASVSFANMLCASTNVVEPLLKVAVAAPSEASLCDEIPFTFRVENTGTGTIRDVKVDALLPAGWKAKESGTSFDAGTLGAAQQKEFKLLAKASKTGPVDCTVSAKAADGITATGNTVNLVIRAPALSIEAAAPAKAHVGADMPFTFTVKNGGDYACADTVVTAPLPAGVSFVRADHAGTASAGTVTWKLGSLAVGESRKLTLVAKNTGIGMVQVTATVEGACSPVAMHSCSTSVEGVADIGTGISDDDGVVAVGENHVFTTTVKNQGQVNLTSVTVVAELDPGLVFVSTDWPGGATAAGNLVTWKVGTIKPGEQKTFRITCRGEKTGSLQIQTATTSDQTPRAAHNDEQVNYIEV